ncbi:MAG: NFACT family protein [Acidobacteriia bacterium]|nr:NFACT family protein [Terriglobia bacterium]
MDNLAIETLVNELRSSLLHLSCVQVAQVSPAAVSLEFSGKPSGRLLFDVTDPPLFFLTRKTWSSDVPSSFVAVLRKWLIGTGLAGIRKKLDERAVHFEFLGARPEAHSGALELVAEFMPRWGNLYLLDEGRRVLGALLIPRAERRKLTVGGQYIPPSRHGDSSLENFIDSEAPLPALPADANELTKHVRGLGPVYAREVLLRAHRRGETSPRVLSEILRAIAQGERHPRIYEIPGQAQNFFVSPIELESLSPYPATIFDSVNLAVESLFERRIETVLLEKERKELRKDARTALKKFKRLEEKLESEAQGFLKEAELQRVADLILAQPGELHPQGGRLELVDVYEPTPRKFTVAIDARLSPAANAQRFHEKAKRARRGIERIKGRQHSIHRLVRVLESSLVEVSEAQSLAELKRISTSWREEASNTGETTKNTNPPRARTNVPMRPAERKRKKCRIFKSTKDYEILVGRNSKENDLVTTRYAQPDDYWFHVADYAGSHVVLRNPNRERLEETQDFLEAAQLAAYFSQTRNAQKALVHWTQRKFVKKPKRAKPGLVTLSRFQSLLVEPKLPGSGESHG